MDSVVMNILIFDQPQTVGLLWFIILLFEGR